MRDSRTSAVTKKIRADIIAGQLPAGTRLTESVLAERYNVSRMPVRESLRVLAAEGLVEVRPYAGATVAAVPDDDATDLFAIRIELEGATARRAAENSRLQRHAEAPDTRWWTIRRELSRVLADGDEALENNDLVALAALNVQFHQLIAELSGSTALMSLLEQISGRIEWLYSKKHTRRGGQAWTEHHAVMRAIDEGNPTLASELMSGHVRRSKDSYLLLQQETSHSGSSSGALSP